VPEPASEPRAEYTQRLEDHLKIVAAKERLHLRCGNLKLLTIVLGIVVGVLALYKALSPYWILAPVTLFAVLIFVHERILRGRDHAQTVVALYRRGIGAMPAARSASHFSRCQLCCAPCTQR